MNLTELSKIVNGKKCTLLGSAPGCYTENDIDPSAIYAACNLSSLGASINRIPDVTFIGSYTAISNQIEHTKMLNKLKTASLFIIGGAGDIMHTSRIIKENVEFSSSTISTLDEKIEFLNKFIPLKFPFPWGTGSNIPSTGLMSALLLNYAGATHVECIGFSKEPGHSYINNNYPRGHLDVDCKIIKWIMESNLNISFPKDLTSYCQG